MSSTSFLSKLQTQPPSAFDRPSPHLEDSCDSSSSSTSSSSRGSFTMDSPRPRAGPSVEIMRCSRCAKCVETITSPDVRSSSNSLRRVSTDDASANGMVRFGHNLYYCDRCAKMVGYKWTMKHYNTHLHEERSVWKESFNGLITWNQPSKMESFKIRICSSSHGVMAHGSNLTGSSKKKKSPSSTLAILWLRVLFFNPSKKRRNKKQATRVAHIAASNLPQRHLASRLFASRVCTPLHFPTAIILHLPVLNHNRITLLCSGLELDWTPYRLGSTASCVEHEKVVVWTLFHPPLTLTHSLVRVMGAYVLSVLVCACSCVCACLDLVRLCYWLRWRLMSVRLNAYLAAIFIGFGFMFWASTL